MRRRGQSCPAGSLQVEGPSKAIPSFTDNTVLKVPRTGSFGRVERAVIAVMPSTSSDFVVRSCRMVRHPTVAMLVEMASSSTRGYKYGVELGRQEGKPEAKVLVLVDAPYRTTLDEILRKSVGPDPQRFAYGSWKLLNSWGKMESALFPRAGRTDRVWFNLRPTRPWLIPIEDEADIQGRRQRLAGDRTSRHARFRFLSRREETRTMGDEGDPPLCERKVGDGDVAGRRATRIADRQTDDRRWLAMR